LLRCNYIVSFITKALLLSASKLFGLLLRLGSVGMFNAVVSVGMVNAVVSVGVVNAVVSDISVNTVMSIVWLIKAPLCLDF
jgi:hypothetical protein